MNAAVALLCLRVPAMGCPIPEHEPILMATGLCVCPQHLKDLKAADFFDADPRWKEACRKTARTSLFPGGQVGAEPDFERAFVDGIPLESEEAQQLLKILRRDR